MSETLLIGVILVLLSAQTGFIIAGIYWLKLEFEEKLKSRNNESDKSND
ncbi:hypothetical protein [Streptococcus suis]|nr:hypothetical protein [Streptococcus suis]MCO8213065.1 hypothetical protein [Streptococcus suis]MCO8232309.1 hypothetical protein [Streptococcus suis]HEM3437889.1 hypothetical protein [Streptococcus suis]HEM3541887.1 hypothetical protein [Streptococcus suis]